MMKRHTFSHDGFERTCRLYPTSLMLDSDAENFSTNVPADYFPDVEEEVPRMPVMECKVRCQRRHHKIIIWPNGRITLAAHVGRSGVQTAKVAEMMGQRLRCFEVLENWRGAVRGDSYDKKNLPKPMQALVDPCLEISNHRQRRKRSYLWRIEQHKPVAERAESMRRKRVELLANQFSQEDGQRLPLGHILTNAHYRGLVLSRNLDVWSKEMIPIGLGCDPLCFGGNRFIPFFVAPSTVALGTGPCICKDEAGKIRWVWIERKGKRHWEIISLDS